ncbi:MAG: aminotransferase class IV family protein [Microscillaceae bacterium]
MENILLESIRLYEGQFANLRGHQARLQRAFTELFPGLPPLSLFEALSVPAQAEKGLWKCRIEYGITLRKITYSPYQISPINQVQLVEASSLDYRHKWVNRQRIDQCFALRQKADEILMIKNGFITDTSYGNIVFEEGNQWFTPAFPLLEGTQRALLLEAGQIKAEEIRPEDLKHFRRFKIINALRVWDESPVLDIRQISL